MFDRIKALLTGTDPDTPPEHSFDRATVSAAALLVCAAHMDAEFGDEERSTIEQLVKRKFDLSDEEAKGLVAVAGHEEREANDLFRWTQVIKESYDAEEKLRLIEAMWEVAFADGELDDFEGILMRRVAGLIYVPDKDVAFARQRVLERKRNENS